MHRTSNIAFFSFLGASAVFALSGCKVTPCTEKTPDGGTVTKDNCYEIENTIEYRDSRPRTGFQNWSIGRGLKVMNHNGPLKVQMDTGLDGQVVFSGIPFTREVSSEAGKQKATEKLAGMAEPAFTADASGNLTLDAPGKDFDGYDLLVRLPNNFNGALAIVADNGKLTLFGAPEATSTTAVAHGIFAENLRNTIQLTSEVGEIDVTALPSGMGNVVHSENGKVVARIGMANLTITAMTDLGKVTFPPAWSATMVGADGKTGSATLGDGSGALSVTTGLGDIVFDAK